MSEYRWANWGVLRETKNRILISSPESFVRSAITKASLSRNLVLMPSLSEHSLMVKQPVAFIHKMGAIDLEMIENSKGQL